VGETTKRSIPVRILGQEYRVRSEAGEEMVRKAAVLVDETMQRVRDRTATVDTMDVAVLTALQLANRLIRLGEGGEPVASPVDSARIRALIDLVESVSGNGASASS
jgi:cell division protein ZapA